MSKENIPKNNNTTIEDLELLIKKLFEKLNKSEMILDEIEGWNGILQIILKNKDYFYIFNSGLHLEIVKGKADNPDCTLTMTSELAKRLFSGQIDLFDAIISRKIKIRGESSHFMKLTVLLEYLEDEKTVKLKKKKKDWIVEKSEEHGMKSDLLDETAKKLKEIDINRNSFLVIRHGVLVYEKYYAQRSYEIRVRMHYDIASITKTMAALVVGVAVTQGLFDVDDYVTDWISNPTKGIVPGTKIKHILSQTAETEPPGTNFKYNSGDVINTLGQILTIASGMPSKIFARINLFEPLGIIDYSWSKAVANMTDLPIGFGMKISPREAAKLGQLFLNKGKWDGKQIISEHYLKEMVNPPFLNTNSGYGYLVWLNNSLGKWYRPFKNGTGRMIPNAPEDMFMATGFYGRIIFIIPSLDIVIVTFGKKLVMESLDTAREFYNAIAPVLPSQ
jgi:CubicO group peptidase (beta-lactamase class C family)/putative sterol carrier protein